MVFPKYPGENGVCIKLKIRGLFSPEDGPQFFIIIAMKRFPEELIPIKDTLLPLRGAKMIVLTNLSAEQLNLKTSIEFLKQSRI